MGACFNTCSLDFHIFLPIQCQIHNTISTKWDINTDRQIEKPYNFYKYDMLEVQIKLHVTVSKMSADITVPGYIV